jgi:hypothetical protein
MFSSAIFCSVLFCSVQFYYVLLCSVVFYSFLFCSFLLCYFRFISILFLFCSSRSILYFGSFPLRSVLCFLFRSILFCSIRLSLIHRQTGDTLEHLLRHRPNVQTLITTSIVRLNWVHLDSICRRLGNAGTFCASVPPHTWVSQCIAACQFHSAQMSGICLLGTMMKTCLSTLLIRLHRI